MALNSKSHIFCGRSELDYDQKKFIQNEIDYAYNIEISPKNVIQFNNPIHFQIDASSDFTDLNATQLYVQLRLSTSAGAELTANDTMGVCNNLLHSLFSQVSVSLKETLVSYSSPHYAYRAYIENLLNYSSVSKDTWLFNSGWITDTPDHFDLQTNLGLQARKDLFLHGKLLELTGRIHSDLNCQKLLIPSNLDIKYTLTPSRPEFLLQNYVNDKDYKLEIISAKLLVKKIKLHPAKVAAFERAIIKRPIKLPLDRVKVQSVSIAKGLSSFTHDSAFTGILPSSLVVGLLDNDAYTGHFQKSPFNFKHFNLSSIQLTINGRALPSVPIICDFPNNDYIKSFQSLYDVTGNLFTDWSNGIKYNDYPKGNCLYGFRLSSDSTCTHDDSPLTGTINLGIQFATALPNTVTLLLYSVCPAEVTIDSYRNVLIDAV